MSWAALVPRYLQTGVSAPMAAQKVEMLQDREAHGT